MEHKVKSYKRRTKSGKVVTVKAHNRKGKDARESLVRGYGKRTGAELETYREKFGKSKGHDLYQKHKSWDKKKEHAEKLADAAVNPKWSKMKYRDAVKAGAPKLAPKYGEHISKRMNYGTALKHSFVSKKGKKARTISKG